MSQILHHCGFFPLPRYSLSRRQRLSPSNYELQQDLVVSVSLVFCGKPPSGAQ